MGTVVGVTFPEAAKPAQRRRKEAEGKQGRGEAACDRPTSSTAKSTGAS